MARPGRRAAVVGSGFGGLAVAIRLQAQGFQTTLFEARDQPGGRAYVYRDRGHVFDSGPTVVTAPQCLEELWESAGKKLSDAVELLPVEPFYRLVWADGDRFDYSGDPQKVLQQISARNPRDAEGYRRFLSYAREVFEIGYEGLAAEPFLHFTDMVKVVPEMLRLRADRSVYSAVSKFIEDERTRQLLTFNALLVGGNPFDTSSIYTLIHHLERKWGIWFPRGGTGALVQAMADLFTSLGGDLRLSCPVERIDASVEPSGPRHFVTSQAGAREPFEVVVSNAEVYHTYARLYGGHPEAQRYARKLEKLDWSMSLFVLYFGTDRDYREQGLAQHTILFGPRYREHIDEIFKGHKLPDDFSLYVHAPHVTDPSLAPPGGGTFYALSPVPHLGNVDLDWGEEGPRYAEKLLQAIEALLPGLRQHVVTQRFITPRTFESELRSLHGSAFSCAPTLFQSAWFRPHNRDDRIPGLYLVGAGTHPGAGLPGVVNSAKATAGLIARDYAAATA
jgi:phytoene desaturase